MWGDDDENTINRAICLAMNNGMSAKTETGGLVIDEKAMLGSGRTRLSPGAGCRVQTDRLTPDDSAYAITIDYTDMHRPMQRAVVLITQAAVTHYGTDDIDANNVARMVQGNMQSAHPELTWMCIAGASFSAHIEHARSHVAWLTVRPRKVHAAPHNYAVMIYAK